MALAETKPNELLRELDDPKIKESMIELIRMIPDIQKSLQAFEDFSHFGKTVIQDRETIEKYEQKLSLYNINAETLESLIMLAEKLPMIVKVLKQLEDISDFLTSILKDQESLTYLTDRVKEYTDPLLNSGKNGLTILKEAKVRSEIDPQPITLFTIIRWLKDPNVQKGLNYIQAILDILSKK